MTAYLIKRRVRVPPRVVPSFFTYSGSCRWHARRTGLKCRCAYPRLPALCGAPRAVRSYRDVYTFCRLKVACPSRRPPAIFRIFELCPASRVRVATGVRSRLKTGERDRKKVGCPLAQHTSSRSRQSRPDHGSDMSQGRGRWSSCAAKSVNLKNAPAWPESL